MRINVAVPEPYVSAPVLNAALEGVTRLDTELVRKRKVPPFDSVKHRIRWKPEPPGQEHFDHAGVVLGRGHGDCDDMAPYLAGSLRATGEDPGARAVVRRSGPKRWHCVVRRSDGSVDDPSLETGMPKPGRRHGVRGATQPPMLPTTSVVGGSYIELPQIALRPIEGIDGIEAWQARADLPWHWQSGHTSPADYSMISLHRSPVSSQALVGAIHGAIRLGMCSGCARDEHLDGLACLRDACDGATWEELAELYGPQMATAAGQHLVGFFGLGKILKTVTSPLKKLATPLLKPVLKPLAPVLKPLSPILKTALPIAKTIAPVIPGFGPAAALALETATPALKSVLDSGKHMPPAARAAAATALARGGGAGLRTGLPRGMAAAVRPGAAATAPGVAAHRHLIYTGPPIV